jgi:hypothetical protein
MKDELPDPVAEGRTAGVDALRDDAAALAQPVSHEPALCRFPGAVQAVQRDE